MWVVFLLLVRVFVFVCSLLAHACASQQNFSHCPVCVGGGCGPLGGWVGGWVGVTRHSFRYDHGGFGGNSVPTTLQGHGRPRPALELNQAPSPLARPWRFGDLSRDPARDPNRTRGLSPSHRQSATSPTSPLNQPARKKSTLATPEGQFQTSVLAALAGIRAELKTLRTDVNDLMQIR